MLGFNLGFSDDAMGLRGIYTGLTIPKDAPTVDLQDSESVRDFIFSIIYTNFSYEPKKSSGGSKKKKKRSEVPRALNVFKETTISKTAVSTLRRVLLASRVPSP